MEATAGTGRWAVVADGRRGAFFRAQRGLAAWGCGAGASAETTVELRDGKGATEGSGAQHGSVSGPLDSPTPARSGAKGRGQPPISKLLVIVQN